MTQLSTSSVTKNSGVIGITGLPDLNQNDSRDIAILGDTNIRTIDSKTGEVIKEITYFSEGKVLQPVSITSFGDTNNVGVLAVDPKTKEYIQFIIDAATGEVVTSFSVE